ncbi:hypothetical protein PFISCL1PPCAC_26004, partial [Pristionchus fissidentatus]
QLSSAMWTAPATVHNYFNMITVDESNVKSDPPYIGGAFVPDRTFGGLSVSQTLGSFMALNPAKHPHTINYKYIAA